MIRCVIIDDEPLAVDLLASYVEKLDDLTLVGRFTDPIEALRQLQQDPVDLVFLDVQMPALQGTSLARLLDAKTKVVFTTAYPEYAVEGFELQAVDYLVKPISLSRFIQAIDRVKDRFVAAKPLETATAKFMMVKTEYRQQKVNFSDVLYFKGLGDYVLIQLKDSKVLTLENLKSFESRLPDSDFIRVHKSFIVSIDKIEFVEKNRIGMCGEMIPISASYRDDFRLRVEEH